MHRSVLTCFLLAVGVVLRIAGAFHPLWLDEIWSCTIAAKLPSPFSVLTAPAALVDNNHPLNTFWLALIGNTQPYWLYHVPSLLAGIATLVVIAVAAARRSISAVIWAVALAAVSLPLIQFADEARGYALAAFFGVLMFDIAERFLARPRITLAPAFLACCILGGLSHLLILHVYVGVAAMSVWSLWQRRRTQPPLRPFLVLHAGPICFWLAYYALFVGRLKFGGGAPRWFLFQSVCDSLAGLLGYIGPATWLFASALIAALLALMVHLARRNDPAWIFLVIGCFLSPIILVAPQWTLSPSPVPMASRYFLPLVPIVIVLFADAIARARWLALIAIPLIALNLVSSVRFIVVGPGNASRVLFTIMIADPQPHILADHPLRTEMVLDFYAQRMYGNRPIVITELRDKTSADDPEIRWLVVHAGAPTPPPGIDLGAGKPFRLYREFPAFGLSGYDFEIYRRSD